MLWGPAPVQVTIGENCPFAPHSITLPEFPCWFDV